MGDFIRDDAANGSEHEGSETTDPSTCGDTDNWNDPVQDPADLSCELASLIPLPGASGAATSLPTIKSEQDEDQPPKRGKGGEIDDMGLMDGGLMDGLKGEGVGDLVTNFVNDVTTDPVSLDDFLAL